MPRTYRFLNPDRIKLIQELKRLSKGGKVKIWEKVASELGKKEINLGKVNKFTKENDKVVVPGKVLASGELKHKVKIAAFKLSSEAEKKIKNSGGEVLTIRELTKENPTGSGVKILS